MKKKIKKSILSLFVAIAILLGANFSLALVAVNSFKELSFAKYEAKDFTSAYEFSSSSPSWTRKTVENTIVSNTFDGSSYYKNLATLKDNKPSKTYKGTEISADGTVSDFGAMAIFTKDTPVKAEAEKKDDEGKVIWQMDGDNYVFVKDDKDPTKNKEFSSNQGDTERYVLKEGTTNVYYEKVAVMEEIDTFCYYQTNSSLSLKANNWYVLGAYVCTFNTDASIMVTGTNFEKEVEVPNTNGNWQLVYIFMETSSDSTNSVNIRFYYGNSTTVNRVNKTAASTDNVTGAAYLDHVTVQTISQTEFKNKTINGEKVEGVQTNSLVNIVDRYSVRYDYSINKINNGFENDLTDNNDNTFSFNLYEKLYGTDDYDASADELVNKHYYQYFINKYTADDGKEKLTDKQLGLYHKAYNEKLTTSVVLESKEFETEEEVKDESGNPVLDGNQQPTKQKVPAPSTFNDNNHVLKLVNTSEKYSLGLLSAPIEINQFSYYKLTVFVRGLDKEDSATVKLISYIKTGTSSEEGAMQVKSQTVTPYTTDSDITNNWTEVNFYIQGSSYYDTTMQIALLADKESTVYYDAIRLESITSKTYTDSTSSKQFNLFPSSTAISSSISNGNFDAVETDKVNPEEISKPYNPYKWEKIKDSSKNVVAGVVSTKTDLYSATVNQDGKTIQELLGGAENPIRDYTLNGALISPARTNVLAIYSPKTVDEKETKHDYGYKSSSISLSSNSAYKITVQVYVVGNTANSNFSGNVYLNLIASDNNIAEFNTEITTEETETKGKWLTYTFAVHTGSASRTVYIELGVKNANGTVFFQKVNYKKLAEKTVENEKISVDKQFEEIQNEYNSVATQTENRVKVVNFEKNPFVMHSENKVENKDYYESLSHSLRTGTDNKDTEKDESIIEQGEMGIVDLTEADGLTLSLDPSYNLSQDFLSNPKASSKFAMFIYNGTNHYTQVSPNSEISLSSSSYYEISVYVKTKDIAENKGLKIYIDKISVTFDNINTETNDYGSLTETNGYKKFTAYVQTGSSTISGLKIIYELGSEKDKITGTALISDVMVTKIADETAYNELVEKVNDDDKTSVIKNFAVDADHSHEHDHADNLTLATFFLVFSSLLLVAALVFALISVYVRKNVTLTTSTGSKTKSTKKDSDIPKDGFV